MKEIMFIESMALFFREYTYWSSNGFKLFSGPKMDPSLKKLLSDESNYL